MRQIEPPGPQYPTGAPYHTGENYTETARMAAERNFAKLRKSQAVVIELAVKHGAGGITTLDCEAELGRATNWYSPRFDELIAGGIFYRTGAHRHRMIAGERRGPALIHWIKPYARFDPEAARPARSRLRARIVELEAENAALRSQLRKLGWQQQLL